MDRIAADAIQGGVSQTALARGPEALANMPAQAAGHVAPQSGSARGLGPRWSLDRRAASPRLCAISQREHATYVALLRRAYELWRELEGLAGERLLHITGSVDAGPEGGAVFEGARRSSELHGLATR